MEEVEAGAAARVELGMGVVVRVVILTPMGRTMEQERER